MNGENGFGAPGSRGAETGPCLPGRSGAGPGKSVLLGVAALTAFLLSACRMTVFESPDQLRSQKTEGRVLNVQMKSGEVFEFPKGRPAYLDGNSVVGEVLERVVFQEDQVSEISRGADGGIREITMIDGSTYEVVSLEKQENRLVCEVYSPVTIPVDEIRIAKVNRPNKSVNNVLEATGAVLLIGAIITAGVLLDPEGDYDDGGDDEVESCPFVYSYDGRGYVLDAEPYGSAVCRGLQRTEWASLDGLAAVDGEYRVLLSNELDETQYTDDLKLIAVDHPPGVEVAPDLSGGFHSFSEPLPPLSARDGEGRDILPLVARNDGGFWLSRLEEKDPARPEDLRDELTFEFAKPAGARRVKLLANVWTTMWGSQVIRKFLEVRGEALPAWYSDVDAHGPEYGTILGWQMREELYLLKIWVETNDGWKVKGLLAGGGPYVSKAKAYVLDIADVPGETLRIRLRPPVNFWMLNRLAVDYGEDTALRTAEMAASRAVGRNWRASVFP